MNNDILIGAEGIDGANFLAACLTMSDNVYFNNYTLDGKKEFYFNGMTQVKIKNDLPIWTDVSMLFHSCARRKTKISFGTYQVKKIYESVKESVQDKSRTHKVHLPINWPLENIISKNLDDPLSQLFKSKYFIGLINPDLFICLRLVLGNPDLDLITIKDFDLLPKKVQDKFKDDYRSDIDRLFKSEIPTRSTPLSDKWDMLHLECEYNDLDNYYPEKRSYKVRSGDLEYYTSNQDRIVDIYKRSNEILKSRITHEWDCNWFLTEKETVKNIDRLYSELNLGKCNKKLIRSMYRTWISRIDTIKKTYINAFLSTSINNDTVTT